MTQSKAALTLGEIAAATQGELQGNRETQIFGAASLAEATANEISFFYNPRYSTQLRKTRAAAVFVPHDFADDIGAAVIRVENPAKAFEQIAMRFAPAPVKFESGPGRRQCDPADQRSEHIPSIGCIHGFVVQPRLKRCKLFADARVHTNWEGAVLSAECVVRSIKSLPQRPRLDPERDAAAWKTAQDLEREKYGWGDGLPVEITPP